MKKIILLITISITLGTSGQSLLVKDIETGSLSSMPDYTFNRADYNGELIFTVYNSATDDYHLWSTDGTESGTQLIKTLVDYQPTPPQYLTYSSSFNKVFFGGIETCSGTQSKLYSTDGTTENTLAVAGYSNYVSYITNFHNGNIFYKTEGSGNIGHELAYFDGTSQVNIDLNPGAAHSFPSELTVIGNKLYFSARANTVEGNELCVSDGTVAGTYRVKDINPSGSGNVHSNPKDYIGYNNKVYFTADNGPNGRELWETDGTETNTKMVADMHPGNNPSFYVDPNFTVYKGELYFTGFTPAVGVELFKIDTSGNITNVADINSGTGNHSYPRDLFIYDNKLFFSADDGTNGRELWYTEKTGGGTSRSSSNNNTAIFKNLSASGDSNPTGFIQFDGKFYFNADNGVDGKELWESDGTVAGTIMKQNINPSGDSNPRDFIISNNLLYFSANDGVNGDELWKYSNDFLIGSLSPEDNAADVTLSGNNLTITLNREVIKGAGNIIIHKSSDDSVFETINVSGSNVTINSNKVTITPTLDFVATQEYYVLIDNGTFKDNSNNVFLGISDKTIWNFKTIGTQNQTITFNTLSNKTFGDSDFQLTATASSNLPVSYTSSNVNVATISGNTVTIIGAGTTTITASQTGNASYNAAQDVTQTLTVDKANQTIDFTTWYNKTYGDSDFQLNATASSNLPISYSSSNTNVGVINGNTVTIVGAGLSYIEASQPGNSNYNPATSITQFLQVAKANQSITFNALTNKTFGDSPFNLTATSSSNLSLSYSSSNTNVATINGNMVTIVGAGTTTITASQSGNTNYNAAQDVTQALTIDKANQTITFVINFPNRQYNDADRTLTATSDSGLPVTYTSSDPNVVSISGNVASFVGVGNGINITASQSGNTNYNAAANVVQTYNVAKASQVITFNPPATATFGDSNFTLTASSNSGIAMQFFSFDTDVVSISGNQAQVVGAGNTTLQASNTGNSLYEAASSLKTFTVFKASQNITFNQLPDVDVNDADFNLTATSDSGLPISYSSSDPSVASVSGSLVSIHTVGVTTFTASQPGNDNYNAASDETQTLTVTNTASIDSFEKLGLEIYPNPTSSEFQIKSEIFINKLEIHNLLGQKVKEYLNPKTDKFSINELKNGVYIISVYTKNGIASNRIIKID